MNILAGFVGVTLLLSGLWVGWTIGDRILGPFDEDEEPFQLLAWLLGIFIIAFFIGIVAGGISFGTWLFEEWGLIENIGSD